MNKFFAVFVVALLSVSLAAAMTQASPGSGGIYVYTDKEAYASGDSILVTAANKGTNYVSYTSCGGVFFSVTDSSGNEIAVTNPLLGRPCRSLNLYLQQSLSYKWDQTYYDGEGNAKPLPAGTYVVRFNDATAEFTVGKPSSSAGKVKLYTSKAVYDAGEKVEFIAYNGGDADVYYGACHPVSVSDSKGKALKLTAPDEVCIMIAYAIKPGQKQVIDSWDQTYYDCDSVLKTGTARPAIGEASCMKKTASSGTYVAEFESAKAKFAIGIESGSQPPAPPTDRNKISIALRKGWNMFSVPVYSLRTPKCDMPAGGGCAAVEEPLAVLKDSTCTSNAVWRYSNGKYQKAALDSIVAGVGYWYHAAQDCKATFEGDSTLTAGTFNTALSGGWNLIGAPVGSTAFSTLANDCSVTSGLWWYDSSEYHKYDSLDEGRAYWVKVAGSCTLKSASAELVPMPASASAAVETVVAGTTSTTASAAAQAV